ncbi:hypothetical protein [Paenibacillus macquariensis]|uniref:Uncharacterized protein n=1 Tax=Paenibacillus macquariensis TaxID=948756 RepID=A0ABY1JXA5_9BACL|nr:hypothetical protein [Paenibacillus macquariensis]MEC0089318.1 hypothetical protein [Paenibacillus macquariensis]OAB33280.1 hypothetical protein PMSM_14805 [Paenibacillus macquariensis subsp. macquariensis]SIQ93915.1 hypothetical protein SAMN05421578_105140 [Paenibacillus macquariensis]
MQIASERKSDTKAKVLASYTDDTIIMSVEVETLPNPENKPGKNAELHINPTTKELFYEYVDVPLSHIEAMLKKENEDLRAQQKLMQDALDELLLGGGM